METSRTKPQVYPGCHWCAGNLAKIALWGNIGLFVLKLVCGTAGDSRAVVADAVHSAADVVLAAILMVCLSVSKSPPDQEHHYGRGKIEYIASLFVGISLSCVAAFIVYDSIAEIWEGVAHQPSILASLALIISIIGNELMFRHSLCCGRRFGSPAMMANAWENRADVYSSLAALLGVVGAQLGLLFMDPVGAILVAILLLRSACQMMRSTWQGILDHALDGETQTRIRTLATDVPGVEGVAVLRTRAMGQYVGIDMQIEVSPEMSLAEGCEICAQVKAILKRNMDDMAFVTVSTVGKV